MLERDIPTEQEAINRQTERQSGFAEPISETQNLERVLNVDDLNKLAEIGLTEQDIVRSGEDIFLREGVTEESLAARGTTGDTVEGTTGTTGDTTTESLTGSSAADSVVGELESSVQKIESEAVAANPGLEVTAELRALWLAQAQAELDPFFQEQIRIAEFDLGTSLNRLIEDTRLRELQLNARTKEGFENLQTSLQNRGLLFGGEGGGVRGQEEGQFVDEARLQQFELGRGLERGLQDISSAAEQTLGTRGAEEFFSGQTAPVSSVGMFREGEPIFGTTRALDVFQPLGDITGTQPAGRTEAELTRASELEGLERERFSGVT